MRRVASNSVVAGLWLFAALAGVDACEAPATAVADFQSELIDIMRAGETDAQAARARLDVLVAATHGIEDIARIVTGRHWRGLSEQQRDRFMQLFHELSVASYASRFDGYSGQGFRVTGSEPSPRGEVRVMSELSRPDGRDTISFEYLLRCNSERWRIVNIIVDGISDLALKRAEYTRLLDAHGFEGLTRELERQLVALTDGSPS